MILSTEGPSYEALIDVVHRYHPAGHLDVEPGYDALPEVRARKAVQQASPSDTWDLLLANLRALWPAAKVMDHSQLLFDCGRQVRVGRDPAEAGHHLVGWASLLAPVGLIYESWKEPGRPAQLRPPRLARDIEGLRLLGERLELHGWRLLDWEAAMRIVPGLAVGNLLPGEATLSACLFSDNLW